MSKKNGAARIEVVPAQAGRDKFNLWTTVEFGQILREYCGEHRIPFNKLAHAALREFLKRHPEWPGESDPMPRGTRLRIPK